MEANKAVIGALLFIILVIGANFVMYAIARELCHVRHCARRGKIGSEKLSEIGRASCRERV